MENADESGGDPSEPNKNAANPAKGDGHTTSPYHRQIAAYYYRCAKNLLTRFIRRPIGNTVRCLDNHAGLVTGVATVAVAFLTYYVAHYTAEQGSITDRQLGEMKTASKQTGEIISLSRDSEYRSLRAYVGLPISKPGDLPFTTVKTMQVGRKIVVWSTMENYGQTPAYNVRASMAVKVADNSISNGLPFLNEGTGHPYPPFTIWPHDLIYPSKESVLEFTNDQQQGMVDGRYLIFFFGRIEYEDTFKINHWTNFCIYFGRRSEEGTACPINNDTDRD